MKDETVKRLKNRDIWIRVLYMILFAVTYGIAEFVLVWVVVFQFFATLINGTANELLLRFGNNLSIYIYECLKYLTFNTELRPFPFAPWPDEEPGGERWTSAAASEPETESDEASSDESDADGPKQ